MKVSIYDREGRCVGVAFHENDVGYVSFPPATHEVVVVAFALNDGEKQELTPMRMPIDSEYALRIYDPSRLPHRPVNHFDVARTATKVSWWVKVMRWVREPSP